MTEPATTDANTTTTEDRLSFYGLAADGSAHVRELARFMEQTGPRWWRRTTGMERQEFWSQAACTLVVHYVHVVQHARPLAPGTQAVIEHVIRHGHRERPGRRTEYGFVDTLSVRPGGGAPAAVYEAHSVWIDLRDGFSVAAAPPGGLAHLDEELPPIPAYARDLDARAVGRFRWTLRESDPNGHVALLSYLDRAENALADTATTVGLPRVWEGWFRQPSFVGDEMETHLAAGAGGATELRIVGVDDVRMRAAVRVHEAAGAPEGGPDPDE